jgi:hypothetical protein
MEQSGGGRLTTPVLLPAKPRELAPGGREMQNSLTSKAGVYVEGSHPSQRLRWLIDLARRVYFRSPANGPCHESFGDTFTI